MMGVYWISIKSWTGSCIYMDWGTFVLCQFLPVFADDRDWAAFLNITFQYRINFSESKIYRFSKKLRNKFMREVILAILEKYIIEHIISKQDVLLAIHNFSEMKSLAINAQIRFSLKFILIRYCQTFDYWCHSPPCWTCVGHGKHHTI